MSQDIIFLYCLECVFVVSRLYFGIVWITMDFTAELEIIDLLLCMF